MFFVATVLTNTWHCKRTDFFFFVDFTANVYPYLILVSVLLSVGIIVQSPLQMALRTLYSLSPIIDNCCLGTHYLKMLMCLLWTTTLLCSLCGCDVTCLIKQEQLGLELKPFAWAIKYLVSNYTLLPAKVSLKYYIQYLSE